jgi:hypothetical protein
MGFDMTPEEFENKMKDICSCDGGDPEQNHWRMDELMCSLLTELGYKSGIDIFKKSEKWYI